MIKKLLFFIILLFVILGVFGFWYWTRNNYSKDIVKVEILGPSEANFSEEIEYTVKYKNNGNVRLEQPRLIFEFPENTLVGDSVVRRKEVGPEELGDIYPGEEKTYSFKCRIFGKENGLKTANVWLSYQPKNLKARYESSTSFTTKIKSVPLTFDFDLPSKVEANKEFDFSLNYYSVMDYPLSNLTIRVDYPQGFEFVRSKPDSLGKNEWDIPLLNKAEGGRIDIKGKILAELGDHKIFNAQLGMWRDGEFVLLKEISKGVELTEPRLSIFQQINGQNEYVASPGDLLHYEVFYRNVGSEPFSNLFLVIRLEGEGFDLNSVKTQDGQFSRGDNTIIWDWQRVSDLRFLDRGSEGKVEFWVNLKDEWNSGGREAVVRDTVSVSTVKQEFTTKVNSKISLVQQVSELSRPQVGSIAVYTINWQVKNYLNNLENVKVKAVLPPNVRLTGAISPSEYSSNFAFDNASREIVWMVGNMAAGATSTSISFQVELRPNINQRGDNAVLIDSPRIIGEDEWTGKVIEQLSELLQTPSKVE